MTLIVVLRCEDGIVLATDGKETHQTLGAGDLNAPYSVDKIYALTPNIVWSAAGHVGEIQALTKALVTLVDDNGAASLASLAPGINRIAKERAHAQRQWYGDSKDRPKAWLLFAEWRDGRATILAVDENGGLVDKSSKWCATEGDSEIVLYPTLHRYGSRGLDLSLEETAILAYRIMREAICAAPLLGDPICMAIAKGGSGQETVTRVDETGMARIGKAYEHWRAGDITALGDAASEDKSAPDLYED